MEQIETVSKVVDETYQKKSGQQQRGSTYLAESDTSAYLTDDQTLFETANVSKELTLAVNQHASSKETQCHETHTQGIGADSKFYLSDNEEDDVIPRGTISNTSRTISGAIKSYYFDNPIFNEKATGTGHGRTSFADVVQEIMQEPIKGNLHPFGRGSLYSVSLGGETTTIHREEGTLFVWVLVTIMVLGVAVGVILMSQMYQANQHGHITIDQSSTDWNVTEY